MRCPAGRQNVFRHSAALFGAQDHARRAGPAAHQPETVADAEKRGGVVRGDIVVEAEQRPLPGGALNDSLTRLVQPVVLARIEVTWAARAEVKLETAVRRLRDPERAANVV